MIEHPRSLPGRRPYADRPERDARVTGLITLSAIVHLHGGDEAELCLTRPVIARMGDVLRESGRVTVSQGGDRVRVRLDTESDVALAMSLASVALKANATGAPASPADRISPCQVTVARVPVRARTLRRMNGGLRERRHHP
jgi:Family of unknown function (DUF5519)